MMNLPHEVVKALRGHKAAKTQVMTWDGARPVWMTPASGLVIVSSTEPTAPATGQAWLDTGVPYVTGVDWLRYNTITPTTGTQTSTFGTSLPLVTGVDYWLVMQNCAQNAQAEGPTNAHTTYTALTASGPSYYSTSGGGFGSSSSANIPIFTATAASGTSPAIGYNIAPDNYWGTPTSVAQKFQVTSNVTITGLSAYWGGAAAAGKWGIARSIAASTYPLRVWDGTTWQTVGTTPA